jgi:hypothetical protein
MWQIIIARHQTLPTWFDGSGDEPVQCIEAMVQFWIPVVDRRAFRRGGDRRAEPHRPP